jgi:hypothetical protein
MPRQFTAVQARRGTKVHATSVGTKHAGRTLCGRPCDGWAVATEPLNCTRCALRIVEAVR